MTEKHTPKLDRAGPTADSAAHYAIYHLQADKGTWYYSVNFVRKGKRIHRRFYEPKHGGAEGALKAAISWRDAQLAEARALTIVDFCRLKRANNTSGVDGVHFLTPASQPEGIWQARLKVKGHPMLSKSFSVKKFGSEVAYRQAVAARRAFLKAIEDRPYLKDQTALKAEQSRLARSGARSRHPAQD